MDKLNIGIIGCGTILSVHLDAIRGLPQSDLMMVCDKDEEVAKAVAQEMGCAWCQDYHDLLACSEIDVVHILTPHFLHVPMAIDALKAGKHVVLEKPVGITVEQMASLQLASEGASTTIGVTFQNRFNPTTLKMKEIIEGGSLGGFIGAKGLVTWSRAGSYYEASPWRGKKCYEGGGLMINQAIHTLDLMEYIGGPLAKVKAVVANHTHPEIDVEDMTVATLTYESGAVGNFYGTNSHGANSDVELEFVFEKGRLRLLDQQLYLTSDGVTELVANDLVKKGAKSYWGMSHQLIIEDIYNSILNKAKPQVTLKDAIRATRLVFGCYESNDLGMEIVL